MAIKSRIIIKTPKLVFKSLGNVGIVGFAHQDGDHIAEVDPKQSDRELFLTCFHEFCHLTMPDLSEAQVVRMEKRIGGELWKVVLKLKKKWRKKWTSKKSQV